MIKEEFKRLYEQALETAALNAEKRFGRPVPRNFAIELHGGAPQSRIMSSEDAFEEIFLGPERFYRIIDVGLKSVGPQVSTIFMGLSGHEPAKFSETWNDPPGTGPFKQIVSASLEVDSD